MSATPTSALSQNHPAERQHPSKICVITSTLEEVHIKLSLGKLLQTTPEKKKHICCLLSVNLNAAEFY